MQVTGETISISAISLHEQVGHRDEVEHKLSIVPAPFRAICYINHVRYLFEDDAQVLEQVRTVHEINVNYTRPVLHMDPLTLILTYSVHLNFKKRLYRGIAVLRLQWLL